MDKKKTPKDPEKVAEEAKKAATDSKLLSSDPSALSEEALEAAMAAARAKLEEAGYGDRAQAVVDKLKQEVQARQEEEGKAAEAEHIAKSQVADKMVKEGQADTIRKAAENRAKAQKEKQESSPEAKRANVAKQTAAPESAAARTLAKLPPAEKAKIKARAKLRERAEKAKGDEKPEDDDRHRKNITLSNGVNVVLDFSALAPKGQLAFRYKHGWILINPLVPSRGKMGGGLARKHGVKSGTTTKGHFQKNSNGKGSKFVAESTGHPTLAQQIKDTKNKLAMQVAQKKEDAALKAEVEYVKLESARVTYLTARAESQAATVNALTVSENNHAAKAEMHQKAYEAHSKAQTHAANLAELTGDAADQKKATQHSDMALKHQKLAQEEKVKAQEKEAADKKKADADKAVYQQALKEAKAKQAELKKADADKAVYQQALKEAKAKQAELKKAEEAKKLAEIPAFQKVEAGVLVNMDDGTKEKKIVSGIASPKGKLFIHKSTVEDQKGYTVSSVSAGLKLPGEFKTQKEAKAATHWAETTFPGKAFTKSGLEDAKKKQPEAYAKWLADYKSHLENHTWPGYEKATYKPKAKTHEQKMAEAKEAGIKAGKEAYGSLAADKPKAKPAEKKYTKEDFKVTLSGPGMYADGNAIKSLHEKIVMEDNDDKAEAMHAAYMEAKKEFKAKHGVAFTMNKVEDASISAPFTPSVKPKGFEAAEEAGFSPVPHNEPVHGEWKPTPTKKGTYIYSGSSFEMINTQLRHYGPTGWSNDSTIAVMDKEFAEAPPTTKPIVVGRKMKDKGPFPEFPPPMDPGSEYIEKGYSSTSKDPYTWHGTVVMEIRIPKGTKGVLDLNHGNGSQHSSEQEVLLNRGTRYRVVSDSKDGYERKIVVEVVNQ